MSVETALGILLSAFVGFAFGVYRERHAKHVLVHNAMLLMEGELNECQRQIRGLAQSSVLSPLSRLPRTAYDTHWHAAVMAGDFTREDVKVLAAYYNFVDQINRGLDQAHDAKTRGNQKHLVQEAARVAMKANKVASKEGGNPEEDLFQAVLDVVTSHMEKSRRRRIL